MDDPSLMPDLSHLSAEEREIIEQVFKRQRDEEAKETQMSQKATEELGELDKQINERKETSRKLIGTQDDAICQICQKTKFADGIGHKCFYCQLRSCARCGGRSQSKNKAIWACSLCQKRQQILAKTGKWFQPDEVQPKISVSGPPSQQQLQQAQTLEESQQQARPAEPPDKTNSHLMHQQQQPPPQQPQQQHQPNQQKQHQQVQQQSQSSTRPNQMNQHNSNNRQSQPNQPVAPNQNDNRNQAHNQNQNHNHDQSFRNSIPNQQQQQHPRHNDMTSRNMQNSHRIQGPSNQQPHQNSSQTLMENSKHDGRHDSNLYNKQPSMERMASQNRHPQGRMEEDYSNQRPTFYAGNPENNVGYQEGTNQQQSLRKNTGARVTEEDYASSTNFEAKKQRNTTAPNPENHSANVRACPPNDDHMNRVKNRLHRQLRSMSSSEEDMISGGGNNALKISTSAVVAAGGKTFHDDMGASNVQRLSEECNSEKDLLRYIYGDCKNPDQANHINSMKNAQSQRRKDKSLSVSPSRNNKHLDNFGSGTIAGGDLLASRIRTFLSHPVTWQPSADQKRLIGHMILHRTENSASNGDLGLKIVGGRRTDTGKLGAFITQVKPGSVADMVGRLRPGDEVVEWNGQSLQNATYEQVYDSIAASRYDIQVELIVSRSAILPGGDDFLNISSQPQPNNHGKISGIQQFVRQLPNPEMFAGRDPFPQQQLSQQQQILSHSQSAVFAPNNAFSNRNRSTSSYYYPDVPDLGIPPNYRELQNPQAFGTGHIFGRIEVSFVYSHHDRQLSVALERAYDLPPRPDGTPRNPYVKIFLLPDRSEKSRRQSAVIAETLMPVWNEVFYYNDLTEPMILQRVLEMTVWDYDKFGTNSFLGETLIDLASVPLDGEHSLICTLVDMDDDNPLRTRLKLRKSSYHQPIRRPQSELNYYDHSSYYNHVGGSGIDRDEENDDYIDDDELENDIDLATGSAIRKSRPCDRHRRDKSHGYADWSMNHQRHSGAFSRRNHRRPRSATAFMHMGRDEYDKRKFSTNPDKNDVDDYMQNGLHGSQYYLGDSTLYEDSRYKIPQTQIAPPMTLQPHQPGHHQVQQNQQQHASHPNQPLLPGQGYYSDGSETMSVHSCNSMPMITTINRRNLVNNQSSNTTENTSFEENNRVNIKEAKQSSMASSSSITNNSAAANNSNSAATLKERKKSLMTRFIPGRGAGGEGKRTGFARSEEVGIPGNYSSDRLVEPTPPFLKQASKESTDSAHSDNWLPILADGPLGTFVDNLGPGQVVGRQVLASPVLGEIQIGLMAGRSGIDVEIIRAKNLVVKPGVKICPAPYVKVYLMEGKQCVAKAKTNAASKTTNPLFQQHLIFNDTPKKKMLQITVLGDYGRMERKVFMGISQIRLEDLELGSQPLIGWYKLFHSSSLAGTGPVRKDSDVSVGGAQQ